MSELSMSEGGGDDLQGKLSRYPIPDGFATPTEFTHILKARSVTSSLSPQRIYGFIAHRKHNFPYSLNRDGRKMVPINDGIRWVVEFLQRKAEVDAERAAKAARDAEIATAALEHDETDTTYNELQQMWNEREPVELISSEEDALDEWSEDFKA